MEVLNKIHASQKGSERKVTVELMHSVFNQKNNRIRLLEYTQKYVTVDTSICLST